MKMQISLSCKQCGFTLVESLVALLIFSIVILGSGVALARILNVQKNMHADFVIANLMQTRLQNALTNNSDVCSSVDQTQFNFADKTYYLACATEQITVNSASIEWPILAASSVSLAAAQTCATGSFNSECYVVGR